MSPLSGSSEAVTPKATAADWSVRHTSPFSASTRAGASAPLQCLAVVVAAAEVVDEHLLNGFVVGAKDVADGAAADEMAAFFGEVLGVVAGALKRLGHEDDLQAGLADEVLRVLDVPEEDEVAQAVHLGVGAEDIDGLGDIAAGKCGCAVGQHLLEQGRHLGEVPSVFRVDAAADRQGTIGEAEQKVANALESDHDLHAGKEFASFRGADLGDGGGDAAVNFPVESVEFAFPLAQGVEQGTGAGGNAFGRGAGGFFGHVAGFHGTTHDVLMSRFWVGSLNRGTHKYVRRAKTWAATGGCGTVVAILPFVGWT